jgi:hypothetical protein
MDLLKHELVLVDAMGLEISRSSEEDCPSIEKKVNSHSKQLSVYVEEGKAQNGNRKRRRIMKMIW